MMYETKDRHKIFVYVRVAEAKKYVQFSYRVLQRHDNSKCQYMNNANGNLKAIVPTTFAKNHKIFIFIPNVSTK